MNKNTTQKQYQTQLNQIQSEIASINSIIEEKKRDLAAKRQSAKIIEDKINALNISENPSVSEHALLRYFERVLGFDLKDIEHKILNENVLKMISTLGENGTYPFDESHQIILKQNKVVTIQ